MELDLHHERATARSRANQIGNRVVIGRQDLRSQLSDAREIRLVLYAAVPGKGLAGLLVLVEDEGQRLGNKILGQCLAGPADGSSKPTFQVLSCPPLTPHASERPFIPMHASSNIFTIRLSHGQRPAWT